MANNEHDRPGLDTSVTQEDQKHQGKPIRGSRAGGLSRRALVGGALTVTVFGTLCAWLDASKPKIDWTNPFRNAATGTLNKESEAATSAVFSRLGSIIYAHDRAATLPGVFVTQGGEVHPVMTFHRQMDLFKQTTVNEDRLLVPANVETHLRTQMEILQKMHTDPQGLRAMMVNFSDQRGYPAESRDAYLAMYDQYLSRHPRVTGFDEWYAESMLREQLTAQWLQDVRAGVTTGTDIPASQRLDYLKRVDLLPRYLKEHSYYSAIVGTSGSSDSRGVLAEVGNRFARKAAVQARKAERRIG